MRSMWKWIALILWLLLGYFYYQSSCECCGAGTDATDSVSKASTATAVTTATAAAAVKNESGPLMFNWSGENTITGDGWEARRKSLIDNLGENQILEITGLYRAEETNETNFENLGIARANETAKLFTPPLDKERIKLLGKRTTGEVDKSKPFVSARFANRINTSNIKEIEDRTIIRFPFNSTNKLNDREVEAYLDDVAARVKKTGERVRLTGHTDDIGSAASNLRLGQRRADIVKSYLLSKGVPSSKILADSKGESKPIATNKTDAGRAENRRTELQIIK